ncbi:putative DEAD/DEAH box helicase-like protein [Leishmania infantum JPCM5]|uniref:DNA 3'-5' helicase n=2 Tax=Leishmania infantum TaxID=5671 RepID=A0A6L0XXY3_LEIIN|nr:putative DEAD/DEAH box helicase-like protein [Leishmania infantum JPCM5]CAC9524567.1 ATP-dependent_DNA_DEAD/DEAH_box_helicase_-_putative [Leishmania infantum]CAM70893.1 putative DEAD/DEAH box helicase-like protein [Leishmania infantum JPCM5]SUZ44711.1 ATP-dependent_DNA_DEAD/DEAH_box_helicase_-_putative [Leishmania infantum]|eukprot:XP_001467826.1 putative DEAD/DEAH box helicase-like protein [Leishmania infantum JPCM5]
MSTPAAKCLGGLLHFLPHRCFTKVQEAVIPALFTNDRNCLVAAPTGSGKTVLLEVAMLRLFRNVLAPRDDAGARATEEDGEARSCSGPLQQRKRKAVYICPIKALANEKYEHWRAQFPTLTVVIETGDQQQQQVDQQERSCSTASATGDVRGRDGLESMACVSQADILVTTPERWDSITRRWKEKEVMAIVNSVGLLLLDEVHTVQEERGAAMEAIVSRVKVIQASSSAMHQHSATETAPTRIIAISGTLPNSGDLAEWLEVSPEMTFAFAPSDRPVPLTIRVIGYAHDSPNPFAFHRFLSFKIFGFMQQYSQGRPTLVFCASRKETTSSAQRIVEDIRDAAARRGQLAQLEPSAEAQQLMQQASDKQLRSCLMMGVGFHHAAMTREDRQLVERMFREQYIAVVCATTTLALGVNLPAHLVLIKGTTFFSSGRCQDMPVSEVMQMCGRAGRPGCDTHGVALVLTMQRSVHLYETLTSGAVTLTCVESHLHRHMIEHVNAEVALRTIHSFPSAMEWLKTTFFWIRLRKCPPHYGLEFANRAEELEFNAEAFVEALMERALRVLMEEGCVHLSHLDTLVLSAARGTAAPVATGDMEDIKHPSAVFEATRLGRAMSRMYILFDTVCTLNARLKARGAVSTNGDAPDDDSGVDACAGAMDVSVKTTARTGSMSVAEVHEYSHAKKDTSSEGMQPHSTAADATVCSSRRPMMPFNLREVLQLLCHCQELVEVRLRQGDRGPLNELNKTVKYPLHSGRRGGREVREDWQKAYVLIQVHIGLLPLTEVSLRNDSLRLWAVVPRMSRFLEEYAWAATTSYSLATQANLLARCIERRVWPDGLVLRQLKHVSDSVAKALLRGGYSTFESLGSVNARQLEVLCSRLPPFGSQILSEVRRLPRISLDISFMASPAESDGIDNQHRVPSGVVQLTLSPGTEAVTDEGVPNAARRQRSETASSKAAGGKPQLLSDVVALDSTRVLLLVGMPSEDRVLLKRFVPLSAFGSPDAPGSTAEAASRATADGLCAWTLCFPFVSPPLLRDTSSGGGGKGRRIEARCLVLRVVGMDTVTARDEEFTSARGDAASESIHRSAQKPVANACVLFPAPKDVAILPDTKAPQTALSVHVASEARATFNELLEDLQYVASAGDPTQPYRSAPREPPISRKRTRIGQRACRATDDDQGMQKKETRQTNGNTAAMPLPSAMANATSLLPVPGASDLREADGSGAAGAAASEVSQERAAAGGSSLDSVRSSPEHCADKGARLEKPLRDQNTPQHVSEFPSKPVRESPSPRQARLCPSLETGAADALAVSTPSAAHKRVARVRLQPCTSPPASRPPGTSPRACFPALHREIPYSTPQAASSRPVHPHDYGDTPPGVTTSVDQGRTYPLRRMTPQSGQWCPSMVAPTLPPSCRFVVRVPPPHASSLRLGRDCMHRSARQRSDVVEPQEAFYYPVDPQQAPPVMRYAFSGVQGEWWRPSYMQDSSWMHGGAASPHPYPYHTPSMVTRLANYGPMLARPNSVGHLPAHWDHVAAVPASRFAGQHSPSFFASRPPFEFAEEHQQIWQTDSRLSSYPPSSAPGVLLPHQASSPTPYTVLQAQPWPRPPPPPVYDPRDWRPPASMQREPVLPSLWMPVTHEHQKQRFAVTEGDPRARTAPSDMSVSRADASVARPASMPTSDGGNFPSRVRRRSPMVAQSWWQ